MKKQRKGRTVSNLFCRRHGATLAPYATLAPLSPTCSNVGHTVYVVVFQHSPYPCAAYIPLIVVIILVVVVESTSLYNY